MKTTNRVVRHILECFDIDGILRRKVGVNNLCLRLFYYFYLKSFNETVATELEQQIIELLFVARDAVWKSEYQSIKQRFMCEI